MGADTAHRKHSVTLPTETSEAITARVGRRESSAFVAKAAARQLERDALDDVLARMEAGNGPVDQAEVDAVAERLTGR